MGKQEPVAVVAGVGPGNGAALARCFAAEGYRVAALARDKKNFEDLVEELPAARGYACDVSDAAAVGATFARIRDELGSIEVLLFNAGSGVFADIEAITPAQFEASWRVNALGAMLCSQQVIPDMKARGSGSIIFIGATASRRGGPRTAAFAPAKAAQRSLAESMAKSLWPSGIHVALIIIDGVVDLPRTRASMPDRPDEAFVDPDGVAQIALDLCRQSPRAWSFEVEARPAVETW
jgi:NAD(P)-dependent dehydrogenase (short-subunit alcohol dehydrogenase family)